MAVKLGLTPDTQWDAGFDDVIAAARVGGFAGLGCPAAHASPNTQRAYESVGLTCHELLALVITDHAEKTLAYAERLAEAAAAMSAPWVNTVFMARPTADAAKVIARCAAILADAGSAMAVEFSPAGTVPGISEGLAVVDMAGHGAGLLVDTWHFTHGPSTWADLESLPAGRIAYVQFTDAAELASDDVLDETMNRRLLPGDGVADVRRFADVILAAGFDGYVSVEVLNRELRSLPVRDVVAAGYDAAARYWI